MTNKNTKQQEDKKFLLEIGFEELPARHCLSILHQLHENLMKKLSEEHNLVFTNCDIYLTPRRLVFWADNLSQENQVEEIKGPLYDIAFDNDKPNKIARKFAGSHSKTVDDIEIRKQGDKKFLFVSKDLSDKFHSQIQDFLQNVINQIHFDRAMRWDNSGLEFSRPIRWITCFIEDKQIDLSIGNLNSSNISQGNRFKSSPDITIKNSSGYKDLMQEHFIMIDQQERKQIIQDSLKDLDISDVTLGTDEVTADLLDEVTYLIEWPTPILCEFEEKFLEIPQEVIISVISKHQKYFPLFEKDSKELSNRFLVIANHKEASDIIKQGNEKVVRARLSDADFFLKQDLKHDFDYFRNRTKTITFQEKLGSMYDKSERLRKISSSLLENLQFDLNESIVDKAAKYSKADLATTMVSEFTSLEGTIGRIYAKRYDFKQEIAKALEEYYLPRHANDELPTSKLAIILSLADKIDTLYGMFSLGLKPKGNSDPYGLRRAAIAIVRILWENDINISLSKLIKVTQETESFNNEADISELIKFLLTRLEQDLKTKTDIKDTNLLRAAIYSANLSLKHKKQIIQELQEVAASTKLDDLLEVIKRIYNIAIKNPKKYTQIELNETQKSFNESEDNLYQTIQTLKDAQPIGIKDLFALTDPAQDFFENNMIMSKKEKEKNRRLTLLNSTYDIVSDVLNAKYLFN
jgi:glycyl-tRNA synthetase beta chain